MWSTGHLWCSLILITTGVRSLLWDTFGIESLSLGPCTLVLTAKCDTNFVKYYLFTRSNPDYPELVEAVEDRNNLTSSAFNPNHPTKVIIHGYTSSIHLKELQMIKSAYLSRGPHNVLMVEWGVLGRDPCYPTAALNARYVGRCTANLVRAIARATASSVGHGVHVIGFSLGAQVSSFIGRGLGKNKVDRITGLDPALPLFLTPFTSKKLDASDAWFVDVIHTGVSLLQGQYEATGHIDFYVNGGSKQPGCPVSQVGCLQCADQQDCNHHRAPSYFAESILSELGFWGWPCDSWFSFVVGSCKKKTPSQIMGDRVETKSRGVFFVETASMPPFALGKYYTSSKRRFAF